MSEENQSIQNKIHLKHSKPQIVPTFPSERSKKWWTVSRTFSTQGGYKFLEVRPQGYRKWWTEAIQNLYLGIFHITSYNWLMHMIITWHYPLTIGCPKFVTNPPVQQVQHAGPTPALQKLGTSSKPVFTNCSSASSRWPDNHRIYNRSWPPQVGNTWDMRTLQLSWNITTFSWNSIPMSSFTNIFAVLLWTCWGWKKKQLHGLLNIIFPEMQM